MNMSDCFLNMLIPSASVAPHGCKIRKCTIYRVKKYFFFLFYTDRFVRWPLFLEVQGVANSSHSLLIKTSVISLLSHLLTKLESPTLSNLFSYVGALSLWLLQLPFSVPSLTPLCPSWDVETRTVYSAKDAEAPRLYILGKWYVLSSFQYHLSKVKCIWLSGYHCLSSHWCQTALSDGSKGTFLSCDCNCQFELSII